MPGINNTVQLFCGKTTEDAPHFPALEKAGYEIETVPAQSNKHVFHFTGRCNRSVGFIVTARANPYDINALLAESEIANPFLVWSPEAVRDVSLKRDVYRKKLFQTNHLEPEERKEYERLTAEVQAQRKPVIFYGSDEEWKGFMQALDHLGNAGTLRTGFKDSITHCYTAEEVTKVLDTRVPKEFRDFSPADYKFHTFEPGTKPITEYVAENDPRKQPRISVAFFGSASSLKKEHIDSATRSVEMCNEKGWGIVNGGGVYSVMGEQIKKSKELGVYVHGISAHERGAVGLTGSEKDPAKIKQLLPRYTDCKDMIHRIEHYLEHAQGIGVLDGGIGSAEEIFMVLEMIRQQHKNTFYQDKKGYWNPKPYIVIDENGTWAPVLKWAKEQYGEEYMAPLQVVHSMKEAQDIYSKQFEQHAPKLPVQVIDNMIHAAEDEIKKQIPTLTPITSVENGLVQSHVTSGRPKTVQDFQSMMSLVELTGISDGAKPSDIDVLCDKAKNPLKPVRAVSVPLRHIKRAKGVLAGSNIKVTSFVPTPSSPNAGETIKEVQDAITAGADAIQTSFPQGLLEAGKFSEAHNYLTRVIHSTSVPISIALDTDKLTSEQIVRASIIAKAAGVKSIMASSRVDGVNVEAVELIRRSIGDNVGVEVSHKGALDYEQAMALIESGANALSCSGFSITSKQERVPALKLTPDQEHLPSYVLKTAVGM